jgi:Mrp family chromosome partitioning ATPase
MLTSDHVRTVIADAAERFDWVLLDTPPVGLLPDAQLVARLSDGVLFVIAAGVTSYSLVQRCIAELGADRIVGTVLNRVVQQRDDSHDYTRATFGRSGNDAGVAGAPGVACRGRGAFAPVRPLDGDSDRTCRSMSVHIACMIVRWTSWMRGVADSATFT